MTRGCATRDSTARRREPYLNMPAVVFAPEESPVIQAARQELERGVRGMLGRTLRVESKLPSEDAIILATADRLSRIAPHLQLSVKDVAGAYVVTATGVGGHSALIVLGNDDRGVLYGVFALLRRIALHREIQNVDERSAPFAPVRWTNEWNNLDGSIERGYGGRSIFFD